MRANLKYTQVGLSHDEKYYTYINGYRHFRSRETQDTSKRIHLITPNNLRQRSRIIFCSLECWAIIPNQPRFPAKFLLKAARAFLSFDARRYNSSPILGKSSICLGIYLADSRFSIDAAAIVSAARNFRLRCCVAQTSLASSSFDWYIYTFILNRRGFRWAMRESRAGVRKYFQRQYMPGIYIYLHQDIYIPIIYFCFRFNYRRYEIYKWFDKLTRQLHRFYDRHW